MWAGPRAESPSSGGGGGGLDDFNWELGAWIYTFPVGDTTAPKHCRMCPGPWALNARRAPAPSHWDMPHTRFHTPEPVVLWAAELECRQTGGLGL